MANIDEILAAMPEPAAEGDHEYLVIDPVTRSITVPEAEQIFGVTGDEIADRKYFTCPRIVGDGLDLAGMFIRVNFRNAGGEEDGYLVKDVAVSGEYVTFSWQLSAKVAAYKGAIQFAVCADLPNTADRRMPDWNTTLATGEVLEGLDPDDGDVEGSTSDVVTQLRAETAAQTGKVQEVGAAQVQVVKDTAVAETADAVAAIKAQGEATRASIPADYTTLAGTVDRLTRDRAAAIVCQAEGTAIQVQDASADPLQGLRIFGRSTQDGTPTPDNPVGIVSLPAPVVGVYGKNLLKETEIPKTMTQSGITCDYEGGGVFHIYGTHTGEAQEVQLAGTGLYLPVDIAASYTLAVKLLEGTHPAKFHFFLGLGSNSVTFRNWFSVPLETDATSGALLHDTRRPVDTLGDVTQITRFWIYSYNADLTPYTVNFRVQVWLEQGEAPTEYEPYNGQTLTITTHDSLPGIPVASGGNYTDANGQQWVCDEVDPARGVYVQRIKTRQLPSTFVVNESTNEMWIQLPDSEAAGYNTAGLQCICTHFPGTSRQEIYDRAFEEGYRAIAARDRFVRVVDNVAFNADPDALNAWIDEQAAAGAAVIVSYILAAPIETPLADAELQAFRALHSNKPATTVLNDAGAHMVLEYAADPKTYIDNKLAALTAANL